MTDKQFAGVVVKTLGLVRAARLMGFCGLWMVNGGGSMVERLQETGRCERSAYQTLHDLRLVRRALGSPELSDLELAEKIATLAASQSGGAGSRSGRVSGGLGAA